MELHAGMPIALQSVSLCCTSPTIMEMVAARNATMW